MKIIVFLIISLFLVSPIFSNDNNSKNKYIPREEIEKQILQNESLNEINKPAIIGSGVGVLTGITLSAVSTYQFYLNVQEGIDSSQNQSRLILIGTGIIIAGISELFFDFYTTPLRRKNRSTLQE